MDMPTFIPAEKPASRAEIAQRLSVDLAALKSQVKILIVDDQPNNLLALEAILEELGHPVVRANSGDEALKHLLNDDFAVILMDVVMPGMDGFETAQLIRQRDRSRFTPIIFLTAINKSDIHVTQGYSVGAVDYLFKPIVPEILKAKVSAFVELFLKTLMIADQSKKLRAMERQWHQAELDEAQRQLIAERLEHDVRAARKVQQLFFPRRPPTFPGFDIAGASYPAEATGGDYFDFIPSSEGFLDIVVADVSGHGFAAALLMSTTRAYLRALALASSGIDQLVALANRALSDDMDGSRFVTLLYARLAPGHLSFRYTSAGHPPAYVMTAAGEIRSMLHSTAVPLGIMNDGDFPIGPQVEIQSGDLIFLFTDGVTEANNQDGIPFGADQALKVLRDNRSRSAMELVEILYQAVSDFIKRPVLEDDVTAVIIKVL